MKLWRKLLCWWYREPLWHYPIVINKKRDGRVVEEYGMYWCPNCERWVGWYEHYCEYCGMSKSNFVNADDV